MSFLGIPSAYNNRESLTHQQKIDGYKFALNKISWIVPWICPALMDYCNSLKLDRISSIASVLQHFPEFLKYKPDNKFTNESWFNENPFGYYKRRRILKRIIKQLEKQQHGRH